MKKLFFLLTVFFLEFIIISSSISCKKTETMVPVSTVDRDNMLGTYIVTVGCPDLGVNVGTYSNIKAGSANNLISIDGSTDAIVSGTSLTLVKFTNSKGAIISGTGELNGKTLTLNLLVTQGSISNPCNLVLQKQ